MKCLTTFKRAEMPSSYSPHGEYGLKSLSEIVPFLSTLLLSTRRVWIEIAVFVLSFSAVSGYSPHGEYGLKSDSGMDTMTGTDGYSPHGEYGLK